MLREMRTVDRDRDRILPEKQVSSIIKKYQVQCHIKAGALRAAAQGPQLKRGPKQIFHVKYQK